MVMSLIRNVRNTGFALTLLGLLVITVGVSPLFAQEYDGQPNMAGMAMTHEGMHQMMDAMYGEGTSQRMHESMGAEGERMMDQCVAMMNMMQMMWGRPGMMGLPEEAPTPAIPGNQMPPSMQDMMQRMMGP